MTPKPAERAGESDPITHWTSLIENHDLFKPLFDESFDISFLFVLSSVSSILKVEMYPDFSEKIDDQYFCRILENGKVI